MQYGLVLVLAWINCLFAPVQPVGANSLRPAPTAVVVRSAFPLPDAGSIQSWLSQYPGPLKSYDEGDRSAAAIIADISLYYGVNPRILLALLETTGGLISKPTVPDDTLRHPFSTVGPDGFSAQVEWAGRELRAGLGPYDQAPLLSFSDHVSVTLTLAQAPEGISVQRFLANGRTSAEWQADTLRFNQVFSDLFNNELPDMTLPSMPSNAALSSTQGWLYAPWRIGTRMYHLSYFDHTFPTVDSGDDGNDFVTTYLGVQDVQYDGHDGHDFYFPDQPIGTPMLAAASGIAYARTARGNGVVIIHPNGFETVYWHLDKFDARFANVIDKAEGVPVVAGDVLGVSGMTGFTTGTPHLHFEVRYHGKEYDPYGWYGGGIDPCVAYAGCVASSWLWHPSLRGTYDFTPPDERPNQPPPVVDRAAPLGTFSVNPPADMPLLVRFDSQLLQDVGQGFPVAFSQPIYSPGRYGQAMKLPLGWQLSYPISDSEQLSAGTLSAWVDLTTRGRADNCTPPSDITLAQIGVAPVGAPTDCVIALITINAQRDASDANIANIPSSWTIPTSVTDGWHHIALTWNSFKEESRLYIDGQPLDAPSPAFAVPIQPDAMSISSSSERHTAWWLMVGDEQAKGADSGLRIDDMALFNRALSTNEIRALAQNTAPIPSGQTVLYSPNITLDTNAYDEGGLITAVQLGRNGYWSDPFPYYDGYRWELPPMNGTYNLGVRYFDRVGLSRTVMQTVVLRMSETPQTPRVWMPIVAR